MPTGARPSSIHTQERHSSSTQRGSRRCSVKMRCKWNWPIWRVLTLDTLIPSTIERVVSLRWMAVPSGLANAKAPTTRTALSGQPVRPPPGLALAKRITALASREATARLVPQLAEIASWLSPDERRSSAVLVAVSTVEAEAGASNQNPPLVE